MRHPKDLDRLGFLHSSATLLMGGAMMRLEAADEREEMEEGISAPEDLMREHGVLNRCLLIHEDATRKIEGRKAIPKEIFAETASIIRRFVEDYHEKNEGHCSAGNPGGRWGRRMFRGRY